MALQRLQSGDPDITGTLHLLHAVAEDLSGTPEGFIAGLHEANTLIKVGRHDAAIALLQTLQQIPESIAANMPRAPSWSLGPNVPFEAAVLDHLAYTYDVVGNIAASCNCSSSALSALKLRTRQQSKSPDAEVSGIEFKERKKLLKKIVRTCESKLSLLSSTHSALQHFPAIVKRILSRDMNDDHENAVKELLGMSKLFGLLSNDALFRMLQGIVAVLPSASTPNLSMLLLQTILEAMPYGHSCIHASHATAINVLIAIIESPKYSEAHKDMASVILSLIFSCNANAAAESRALHFSERVISAASTSDVQKYNAAVAIGRIFSSKFHLSSPLAAFSTSDHMKQLSSSNLVLSSGLGLWQLAALKRHSNSTLRSVANEVLQLAVSFSPEQLLESYLPHIENLLDLLSEYLSSKSSANAVNVLAFGVASVRNEHQFYAWVVSNASRLLVHNHGLDQVMAWLQQLRPQHDDAIEQFIGTNDWKCSAFAPDSSADPSSARFSRTLHAAKHTSHAAGCAVLYQDYLSCYSVATADPATQTYGGVYSRIKCMSQYRAARLCSFVNEKSCHDTPQHPLAPTRHSRAVPSRLGPMLYLSPDYYFRVGLGVYGEWSYLEAAGMQASIPVGGTVVDVGTHIGTMLLAFAEKVGRNGRVIGIEAQRVLASIAAQNAVLNGHHHVQVINAAVDSSPSTCIMSFESQNNEDITNYGGFGVRLCSPAMLQACSLAPSTCQPHPAPDVSIINDERQLYTWLPTITIDSLQLQRCDLIKFDVEGWETRAINGAIRTISRFKPVLFFEADGASGDQDGSIFTKSPLVAELLQPLGYVCVKLSFPLFNPSNVNNVTKNLFGDSQSIMVSCSVAPPKDAEAAAEL
jgi:FkbM family methyltransferase